MKTAGPVLKCRGCYRRDTLEIVGKARRRYKFKDSVIHANIRCTDCGKRQWTTHKIAVGQAMEIMMQGEPYPQAING